MIKNNITRDQKDAIAILSVGTFLEFFDLKLYIHMAVILNSLFFPKTDPFSSSLLSSFAFCSSFIFSPIGAIIFGYIGDKVGRKATVFITTFLMGAACFTMYKLPEYSEIGIWASILMLACRAVQGMACLGESRGADIYIAETVKPPAVYSASVIITMGAMAGGSFAIFLSKMVLDTTGNWRYVFLCGSIIAFFGLVFRVKLSESSEFADANKRLPKDQKIDTPVNKKLILSLFFMRCLYPFSLYLSFNYMPVILKQKYGYDMSQILSQNLTVTIIDWVLSIGMVFAAYYFHPLKIIRLLSTIYIPLLMVMVLFLSNYMSPTTIFIFQLVTICLSPNTIPAEPMLYKSFPVFKRFRAIALTFSIATAMMYLISSFGIEIIVDMFGISGLYIILVPFSIAYIWGLGNFIEEERKKGSYTLFNKDALKFNR